MTQCHNSVEFEIPGTPIGKGRPQFTTRGGYAKAYTPKKTREYETLIKRSYLKVSRYKSDKSVRVIVNAQVIPPKSKTKKFKTSALLMLFHPTTKPDIDNILKCVLDALNDVAYKDDNQVTEIMAKKSYAQESKVIVTVQEIGEAAPK